MSSRARARGRRSCALCVVAVLCTPFWYSDLVLAGRFDVGVGGGGKKLVGPLAVFDYLGHVAGDFTAGFTIALGAVADRWRRSAPGGSGSRTAPGRS